MLPPVLPSIIAYDMSYMQYYAAFQDVNVSLEFSGGDERLIVNIELVRSVNILGYSLCYKWWWPLLTQTRW